MFEPSLAEPLLQRKDAQHWPTELVLEFAVIRERRSHLTLRPKSGSVRYHIYKSGAYNPFGGLDWHLADCLADATGSKASHMRVRRKAGANQTIFSSMHRQTATATSVHKLGELYSDLQWGSNTYRWELTGPCVPAVLHLVNTFTKECVAQLQCSSAFPWSKRQQRIRVLSGQNDALWLQVVNASGLAEAERLHVANSWTAPKRWAM